MALMNSSPSFDPIDSLFEDVAQLMEQLPNLQHRQLIQQTLATVVRLANSEIDRLDWKILSASLADMERGLELFSYLPPRPQSNYFWLGSYPHRSTRIPNGSSFCSVRNQFRVYGYDRRRWRDYAGRQ